MKLNYDQKGILKQISEIYPDEYSVRIYTREPYLSIEEKEKTIEEFKTFVKSLFIDEIYEMAKKLATNKDGKLRKRSIVLIKNLDIADYVTDFTNQWYHMRLVIRAIGPEEIEVSFESTSTTH